MRSDSEQMQLQYQQYNGNVQRHVQELNEQVDNQFDSVLYYLKVLDKTTERNEQSTRK